MYVGDPLLASQAAGLVFVVDAQVERELRELRRKMRSFCKVNS